MTIPNIITLFRFLLVPFVVFSLLNGEWAWAFGGFAAAAVSDGLDGFIARNFNQRSELGAYLDPIADKVLLVSVSWCSAIWATFHSGWLLRRCRGMR